MKDKFADLEEPKNRTLPAAIAVLALFVLLFVYRITHIEPIELSGVVESVASDGSAIVRLDNGTVVKLATTVGQPVQAGLQVPVVETPGLLSAPSYRIGSKEQSH